MRLKTTLEQWITLGEVDRAGSIQAAAVELNKSHTTLIYAIRKLEQQLGVALVEIKGRRAVLTDDGKSLLRRAAPMLDQARDLEVIGTQLAKGIEAEITISIDHLCCRDWLYDPLAEFFASNPGTSVQVIETSLTSTREAVTEERADIAIITLPVADHLAEAFGLVTMIPVVSRNHPLAKRERLGVEDLTTETQIVIRDLGTEVQAEAENVGWLKSQQRLTVDNFDHAWLAVKKGLGFCRLPEHQLAGLDTSEIIQLPLKGGMRYQVPLHLSLPKRARTGPAASALYKLLLDDARCRAVEQS